MQTSKVCIGMTSPSVRNATSRLPQLALGIVLAVAVGLRFAHLDWDGLKHSHPDERFINWAATTLSLSGSPADWLHPQRSGINPFYWPEQKNTAGVDVPLGEPRRFAYGHFPFYLMGAAAYVFGLAGSAVPALGQVPLLADLVNAPGRVEFDHITLVGRAISALADSLTVLLVFDLGRRIFGAWTGVLGAALIAVSVLNIQLAHFGSFDTLLATACTATVWAAVRYAQGRGTANVILTGVFAGLALGSKASAALLAIPVAVAIIGAHAGLTARRDWRAMVRAILLPSVVALLATTVTFTVTNPFALLQFRDYWFNITTQSKMVRGQLDWFFVLQYRDTLPYLYHAAQQARWLWGAPLTVAAYGGLLYGLWDANRRLRAHDRRGGLGLFVVMAWLVPYFTVTGAFVAKFPRYMLPAAPVLVLLGAALLVRLAQARRWLGLLMPGALVPTALYAIAFAGMYRTEHPWISASRWIYENIPRGSMVVLELFDDPLPYNTVDGVVRGREETYDIRTVDPFARPDDEAKLAQMLNTLASADYLVIASNRMYAVLPRFPDRYPMMGAYYRALFAGDLGYELVFSVSRSPALGGLYLADDPFGAAGLPAPVGLRAGALTVNMGFADESFTVYDHPLVLVFRNRGRTDPDAMRARIEAGASN